MESHCPTFRGPDRDVPVLAVIAVCNIKQFHPAVNPIKGKDKCLIAANTSEHEQTLGALAEEGVPIWMVGIPVVSPLILLTHCCPVKSRTESVGWRFR